MKHVTSYQSQYMRMIMIVMEMTYLFNNLKHKQIWKM
jgi:hypothetical protein